MQHRRTSRRALVQVVAGVCAVALTISVASVIKRSHSSGDDVAGEATSAPPVPDVGALNGGSSAKPSSVPAVPSLKPVAPGKVTWKSGAYSGGTLAEHKEFADWRGRKLGTALYFVSQDSWDAMENPSFYTAEYAKDRSITPVLSFAMWPPSFDGSLGDGADGDYDDHWRETAKNLVDQGLTTAVIRPGWEFNGSWYAWSAKGTDAGARNFAAYYRHIVEAMRSVPGQKFTFDWNPVAAYGGLDLAKAYPGDAFVDTIGLDVYNAKFTVNSDPAEQWKDVVGVKYGLQWQADFAKEHRKKVSFPEWGGMAVPANPNDVGGDDTLFISNMYQWMAHNPPAFEDYFDFDTTYGVYYGIDTSSSLLPQSAAMYQKLWKTA